MGRHSAHKSRSRLAHLSLLGLSLASVGSPIGLLLVASPMETREASAETNSALPKLALDTQEFQLDGTLKQPEKTELSRPTARQSRSRPPARPVTPRPFTRRPEVRQVPISVPTPAVTTRPSRPTVAQRQVQRAPSSSLPAPKQPPPPTTTPKPPPVKQTTITAPRSGDIVAIAQKYVNKGVPYVYGGNSLTTGMDCSHFIWMVLKEAGHNVPYRDSSGLASWAKRTNDPQPGDLVLYTGHAGIYVGNGMMIDQGRSGGAYLRKVFKDNFIGYGRMPL